MEFAIAEKEPGKQYLWNSLQSTNTQLLGWFLSGQVITHRAERGQQAKIHQDITKKTSSVTNSVAWNVYSAFERLGRRHEEQMRQEHK